MSKGMLELIEKKKAGNELDEREIRYLTESVTKGEYYDYQVAALLMAIRLNGMTERETIELALAMADSGKRPDLSSLGRTADKHSTGGVSDATTFIVVPLLALCGFRVAKMSGRALGFTGGTIDKLESFPGYRVERTAKEFFEIAKTCGAALVGAAEELAPADKVLYALRDVTGTVDSLPLIASSVMSKKIAAGANVIVLDVKYGSGALMRTEKEAEELARLMVKIGIAAGRKTGALVTSMEQPLGEVVGCRLECAGAIDVLRGKRNDLYTVSRALVREACALDGRPVTDETIDGLIDSGAAYEKFCEIVEAHGGKVPESFELAPVERTVRARRSGVVNRIDARGIGEFNAAIGGGRPYKEFEIKHDVGIRLYKRLGDRVEQGEALAKIYSRQPADADALAACFEIGERARIPALIAAEVRE